MPALGCSAPFFIVTDLRASLEFYRARLGFVVTYTGGGGVDAGEDYFAIVERDAAMIMLKEIGAEVRPLPNHTRHEWARWDAYICASDPDALYQEYIIRSVPIHRALADTSDKLRAFEVRDNNGYVICFGRPV
ncbi:MAG TPA: VOC family protein [Terriglobales bacterium]|jgi:catechol 2,3-dioxygenase-like lactoylglutathione lyase family enzyme